MENLFRGPSPLVFHSRITLHCIKLFPKRCGNTPKSRALIYFILLEKNLI